MAKIPLDLSALWPIMRQQELPRQVGVCIWIVGGKYGWVSFGEEAYPFTSPEVQ